MLSSTGSKIPTTGTRKWTYTCQNFWGDGISLALQMMANIAPSQDVLIGREIQSFEVDTRSFKGSIDNVLIYNRALSADEVKALYEYESKPPASPIPTAPAIESINNKIGMTLNKIPAGTFLMGSPEGEEGRSDHETQHPVTISKAFYMQTTEVTQGQWKAVMGTEPW